MSTADDLATFTKRLDEARSQLEERTKEWTSRRKELDALGDFLAAVEKRFRLPVMVPIGTSNMAFMPGEVHHTHEVTVSLGANWFAETSLANARRIQADRRKHVDEQMERSEVLLKDLETKAMLVRDERRLVDGDGDEVNEEGLKYVEINEPYVEPTEPRQPAVSGAKPVHGREAPADGEGMDDFDRQLLDRIRQMEIDEDAEGGSDADELRVEEGAGITVLPVRTQVVERGFESEEISDESGSESDGEADAAARPQRMPDSDDETDEESDVDEQMLGKQLSAEYLRKRRQMVAANMLQPASAIASVEETGIVDDDVDGSVDARAFRPPPPSERQMQQIRQRIAQEIAAETAAGAMPARLAAQGSASVAAQSDAAQAATATAVEQRSSVQQTVVERKEDELKPRTVQIAAPNVKVSRFRQQAQARRSN
ncbi:uri1, prefoldin-like chaperone [Polyrhizophydium stewartii]|uniref:Uri1, prefoldin-like chaperone n=1 Tax=Polyrhizophydium stewartii TaxID=2732419 RepID=A0ABR4NJJ7_9FUNG